MNEDDSARERLAAQIRAAQRVNMAMQNNWFMRYSGFSVSPPVLPYMTEGQMRQADEPIIKPDAAAYLDSWFSK